MIRAQNYETVPNLTKLCVEYYGLFFSEHGVYVGHIVVNKVACIV